MVAQALGERASLDGFVSGFSQAVGNAMDAVQEHPYLLVIVLVAVGFFLFRKR